MAQLSFSTLWQGYATDVEAKAARDAKYRELRKAGVKCRRWVLKNQLRPYASFGVPDGRSCDVYKLDVEDRPAVPYVETDRETAYGSTVRLSRSIRVF